MSQVTVEKPSRSTGYRWHVYLSGQATTEQAKRLLHVVHKFESWRQESAEACARHLVALTGAGGIQRV